VRYTLLQHGGNTGTVELIDIPALDPLVEVRGYAGARGGPECVVEISFTTRSGITYGPFGDTAGASNVLPFRQSAPAGEAIVAFSGGLVHSPLPGGSLKPVSGNLVPSFAPSGDLVAV